MNTEKPTNKANTLMWQHTRIKDEIETIRIEYLTKELELLKKLKQVKKEIDKIYVKE